MSAPAQDHTYSDLLYAITDVLDALRAADNPSLSAMVARTLHVCEPDHQVIAELTSPAEPMRLSLVVDLDTGTTAAGGQLTGSFEDAIHTVTLEETEKLLQSVADLHFARTHHLI